MNGARAILAALVVTGCSITTHVDPLPAGPLPSVCVAENGAVWSKQFLPALRDQLARHGVQTTVYAGATPATCDHRLEYDAEWKWDVAMYLRYADIRIYAGDTLVGRATYDARHAFARFDKFGHTDEKLAKLIDALFSAPSYSSGRGESVALGGTRELHAAAGEAGAATLATRANHAPRVCARAG
jgi:hypothetical protein